MPSVLKPRHALRKLRLWRGRRSQAGAVNHLFKALEKQRTSRPEIRGEKVRILARSATARHLKSCGSSSAGEGARSILNGPPLLSQH